MSIQEDLAQEGNVRLKGIVVTYHIPHNAKLSYCVYFFLSDDGILCVRSSVNSRWRSQASYPRPACRPSSAAPCCTCQTAGWEKTAAPTRPTGSTAALQHFTTNSPPRARRTGGSWTSWAPEQIFTFDSLKADAEGPVQFWKMSQRCGMLCVMFVRIVCTLLNSHWVCNFTITARLKYSLLALISGYFPPSWTNNE